LLSNYILPSSISGAGVITPKTLTPTYLASSKTYDGNTNATVTNTTTGIIGTDSVVFNNTGANFNSPNISMANSVTVSGISISGSSSSNYALSTNSVIASGNANIAQLNSVNWIGGASGLWSDSANWAGGAIPTLNNVANVIIPSGANVVFNDLVQGSVNLTNLSSLGTLNVSGGVLNLTNLLSTTNYNQTAGFVSGVDMSVYSSFTQSGGTLIMKGATSIAQAGGDATLGNISSNTLDVNANSGSINQTTNSALNISSTAKFNTPNGNVNLLNPNNSFGEFSANAQSINLTNTGNSLLADVTANQDLTINANSGSITQTQNTAVIVNQTATFNAGNGIYLPNSGNRFGGIVNVNAPSATFGASEAMKFGSVNTQTPVELLFKAKQAAAEQVNTYNQIINSVINGSATQVVIPPTTIQGNIASPSYSPLTSLGTNAFVVSSNANTQTSGPSTSGGNMMSSLGLDSGTRYNVVSTTNGDEQPKALITMSQLIALRQGGDTQSVKTDANGENTATQAQAIEIRVPMSQNSIVDIVNGGVKLPEGVEQQFFVVEDK